MIPVGSGMLEILNNSQSTEHIRLMLESLSMFQVQLELSASESIPICSRFIRSIQRYPTLAGKAQQDLESCDEQRRPATNCTPPPLSFSLPSSCTIKCQCDNNAPGDDDDVTRLGRDHGGEHISPFPR